MPTPMVVAMALSGDHATSPLSLDEREPAILSFAAATREAAGDAYSTLLTEAMDLARGLGCDVRRRCLGGSGGGHCWVGGRMRIVLDVEATHRDRLEVIADALRGEPRLAWADMSDDLAAYLAPRRAA